jgi:hypothetical protein
MRMGATALLLFVAHAHPAGAEEWSRFRGPGGSGVLEGKVVVVKAAPEWTVESIGSRDEPVFSTPAISGDLIFIRTPSTLYCFEKELPVPQARTR